MAPSAELQQKLSKTEGWKFYRSKWIQRKYPLKDFAGAIRFVNIIAKVSEEMQHHPDIMVQNFSEVIVRSITPSVENLTSKDFELARKINAEYDKVKYKKS
ncbi:MAG: 4a-hydroxytetrahydrobiopterin dehydratase [Candidatus Aenigmarchaeota archaeon]|nr:4a-hydroxytetrahydrobiopterin dehydratase [Candidatus Aenigmarchaeota archaeon]